MKIAFTTAGETLDSQMDPRFGRTEFILLLDEENRNIEVINNQEVKDEAHGAGTATSQKLYHLKPDVLITGNGPGETASKALKNLNMKIYIGANGISAWEAYELYQAGKLTEL